ncbi:site-specific integrase [Vibrio lentus]|uniref:site-specific integrase n=1 Tax=Vibrio TaxID=662 RepID=UPI0013775B41|nr:site-specific integrase [Vibrio lentus]MDH5924688.1 site-specific integrase [Vibrio lentus]NAZ70705.1 site-specific integrase [Vibrio toranzoniae]
MRTLELQQVSEFSSSKVLTVDQLKKLTYQEKSRLSIGEFEGLSLGGYGDDEWLFYLLNGAANKHRSERNLNFKDQLVELNLAWNNSETSGGYTISEAARDCLWLRYQDGISVRTLKSELRAWKVFFLWWKEFFDGTDFEEWLSDPLRLNEYLRWVKCDVRKNKTKSTISYVHQQIRLQPLYQLYKYRSLLKCSLASPPFGRCSASAVVGSKKKYKQTPVIEESSWVLIIQAAWKIVSCSDDAITLYNNYWESERLKLKNKPTRDGNVPSKSTLFNRIQKYLVLYGYNSYAALEREIILFEAAAAVLILGLTGMRQSELSSLSKECYQEKSSDFAVIQFKSSYLQGMTFKYAYLPEGESHRWLVPSKLKLVIEKLNRLNQCRRMRTFEMLERHKSNGKHERLWRDAARANQSLFVSSGLNANHKLSMRWGASTIKRRVDTFMEYLSNEQGLSVPMRVTPHMFRRTFARFIALSPLGSVEALRDQFAHRTGDVTEYYTQGGDEEILNWILEDQSSFQQAVIETQLNHNDGLHGGLGDAVSSEEFASRDFHTSKNLKTLRKKIGVGMEVQLNAHSVSVRPVDKGACSNNCRLNRVQCISCENCVITPAQLPFWEDQLTIMEACAKEGIVQGIDKVRELVSQLKEDVRESAATTE